MILESAFQARLIKEIKALFPGCEVLKNDANHIQGFPDLTVLYKRRWALLESKRSTDANRRVNQEYYIEWADTNSFGAFINPENKEEVLDALYRLFEA